MSDIELRNELESLQTVSARQAIDAEEALHELTIKLSELESQLEAAKAAAEGSREKEIAENQKVLELQSTLEKEREESKRGSSGGLEAKKREEQLQKEKREILSTCVRIEEEKVTLEENLSTLRTLHTSLQSSHSVLETSLQESTTTSRTSLLRLQTLASSVTSLEADKLFLSAELERTRTEAAEYRREKHSELIRVQSESENHEIEEKNAKASLESLRSSHESLTARHLDSVHSLSKVREELATRENNFASEIGSMKRLVEMMESREVERTNRVQEVERILEDERAGRIEREADLLEDLRMERERSDVLEVKCGEMRAAIERGASSFSGSYPVDEDSGSSSLRGSFTLSPSAQMAVKSQRSGRSYAEVYGEYIRMQEELLREKSESARLGDCLAQIMGDIEERAPLLKEQRQEYDRLSIEYSQLAAQLSDAIADREESDRHSEASRLDIDRLQRDNSILGNQLRDLGRQVRALMRSIAASEIPGIGERSGGGEIDEEEEEIRRRASESNDTDAIVSGHLVTFQTINELQIQNQKLLRITREMGLQMERAEEDLIGRRRGLENSAVEEAHELIIKLKDEVETQRTKSDAFLRERDMLRRMLSQRSGGEGFSSTNGTDSNVDAAKLLAEVQTDFDAYKSEIAIHSERLRDDLAQAQRDANNARTELAKQKAHAEFTTERFQLLTSSFTQQTVELAQASKRTLQLQHAMAKQDSSNYKNTEELLTLRSNVDQLRHENTNFRSEQQVWKSVENRLIEENSALSRERSHLTDLMGNLQTMQNKLESSSSESRRRLEEQVVRLDVQTAELREKLNQETDANKQLILRKEFDTKSYQDRLDSLTSEHQSAREDLLVAKTSQEHLQQRIADLSLQITSKEEKLAVYEGRSTANGTDITQTHEQQLEVTVADLRAELRSTKADLERATAHVEQFQAIGETQGESLRQLTATYDEYKSLTDAAISENERETSSIKERLHSLTSEITAGQNLNSELHRQIEEERRAIEKERKSYEDGLANLRAADLAAREDQLAAQDDSRRQAQLAKEANEKYQRELLDHAEDVKRFNIISQELESIRGTVQEHQAASEVAVANLNASEGSWNRQKVALEQEIVDLKKRCDDLGKQNTVLHDHLENFGSQAARLQATRSIGSEENQLGDEATSSDDQLREVIRYLRREKDIGDLQLEFNKQELARTRQQHEYTTRTLEEVRKTLNEQQQKSGESMSSAQHAELLERIHTAKVLRESNQTLRDENESNARKLSQLDSRLQQTTAELEPLKERAQTLQAEVDSKEHNIKLLQEDNERWKARNQTILAKYERIDPEELHTLKNEALEAKAKLEKTDEAIATLNAEILKQTNLADSMRANWVSSGERFKSLQTQARTTRDEKAALVKELADLKAKPEVVPVVSNNLSQAEIDRLVARIATLEHEKLVLETKLEQQATKLVELEQRVTQLVGEKSAIEAQAVETQTIVTRNDKLLKDNRKFLTENKQHVATIAKLKTDFEENHAEAIKAAVAAQVAANIGAPTDAAQPLIEETVRLQVAAMESSLLAKREADISAAIATTTAQIQSELDTLRKELELARATPPVPSDAPVVGLVEFETQKKDLEANFEKEKKEILISFEAEKVRLQADAKAKELEITERLTSEITKASAVATSTPTSSSVDIDALVQAKLVAVDVERSEAQRKAIELAVTAISSKKDAEHEKALAQAREQMASEAGMKHKLILAKVTKLENAAKAQRAAAVTSTHTTPTLSGSASVLPPLVSTTSIPGVPVSAGARGGSIRGTRGSARGAGIPIRGGVAGLALKGVAAAARGGRGGGVLATLSGGGAGHDIAGTSSIPKRVREEESDGSAGDLSKRLKGPPTQEEKK